MINQIQKFPKANLDILVVDGNKVLLGLLTKKWLYEGSQVYGVPGRDLKFNEKFEDAVIDNITDEIGCKVIDYKLISVNENFAFGNHYVGIGFVVKISGTPKNNHPVDWEKWEWFKLNNLPENLFPSTKNLLDCYVKDLFSVSK